MPTTWNGRWGRVVPGSSQGRGSVKTAPSMHAARGKRSLDSISLLTQRLFRPLVVAGVLTVHAVPAWPLQVGITSPQDKVYFQAPFEFAGSTITDTAFTALARNEYEATQVVLFPSSDMSLVRVEVGPLTQVGGLEQIPPGEIQVNVVGYVNQLAVRVAGDRVGWHPDPLLPNQILDLSAGVPQPYLLTVHAPMGTEPGLYEGTITISEDGSALRTLVWRVEVWNFTLPQTPTFKTTSLSFRSDPDDMWPGQISSEAQRDTLLLRLADLGFRNRIPPTGAIASGLDSWTWPDSGYTRYGYPTHNGETFDSARTGRMIDYLLSKGANMFFIGYTFDIYSSCCDTTERRNNLVKYLRDYRDYLAGRGLLDMAYVYNIDEPWGEQVDHAHKIYSLIKSEVGADVQVVQNTNQNNSSIIGSLLNYFDVLDINLGHYYIMDADGYRQAYPAQLSEFWWNVNIWPDSHPNLFLEYSLVDARIFGPLSYKLRINGFEYWSLKALWSIGSYHPVDSTELRVHWNVNNKSLDGSLVYPGSNFDIYSSLRFESFRDGMEDYEYLKLLESADPGDPLLNVGIVTGLSTFSQDPFEIQDFRRQVGELLSSISTDVPDRRGSLPDAFELLGNYPNPFNAGTKIEFDLSGPGYVELEIFDVLGRWLATPHSGGLPAGRHQVLWDGIAEPGFEAPSGVYLYRLSTESAAQTGKMLLLR